MSMKARFEDKSTLIDTLCQQKLVLGDRSIAEEIANNGELIEYSAGNVIIEQGGYTRDMYFILAGKVVVIVHGTRLYDREAGVTIGEMSAIHPSIPRSATMEAEQITIVWKISHQILEGLGDKYPYIWKRLAVDLAGRLEQRNKFINHVNLRPRVFLICSQEALEVAEDIRIGLDHEQIDVNIWSDDEIFPAGAYPLESLAKMVNESDFGIAIAQPDDLVRSRHQQNKTPRDNVIFELGFFMSKLGRSRTLLLVPRGENIKLPSDFKGVAPIEYKIDHTTGQPVLGAAIGKLKKIIREQGVRSSLIEAK